MSTPSFCSVNMAKVLKQITYETKHKERIKYKRRRGFLFEKYTFEIL